MAVVLDFEKPIVEIQNKIDELKKMSEESYERRIFGAIPSMVVHQMNGEVDLSGFNHQNGVMNCFQSKKLK